MLNKTVITIIIFLCIISACKEDTIITTTKANEENLVDHVTFLTTTEGYRTYDNLEALNASAAYIKDQFEEYGLETQEQTYNTEGRREYKNIIATIGNKTNPNIVIGAHYDACGNQEGADDNASGVAGLLELARILALKEDSLQHHFILVGYTLEEPPYYHTRYMGSAVHAKSLKDNNENIKFMISLEMIGYFTDEKKSQSYPVPFMRAFYPDQGNFIAVVGNLGASKYLRGLKNTYNATTLPAESLAVSKKIPLGVDLSDHLNYWKNGFNAIMITDTSFYRNPYYHTNSDTIETLDFTKMARVIEGLAAYLMTL